MTGNEHGPSAGIHIYLHTCVRTLEGVRTMKIATAASLGLLLIMAGVLTTTPLVAQTGNQSDVSGPIATGTSAAPPGSEAPVPASTPEGRAGLSLVSGGLEAGLLLDASGAPIDADAQALIADVLDGGLGGEDVPLLAAALSAACPHDEARDCQAVSALATSLAAFGERPSGESLARLIDRLNEVVLVAPADFFRAPPHAFLAIHAAVVELRAAVR
jgi:hypothetical protein